MKKKKRENCFSHYIRFIITYAGTTRIPSGTSCRLALNNTLFRANASDDGFSELNWTDVWTSDTPAKIRKSRERDVPPVSPGTRRYREVRIVFRREPFIVYITEISHRLRQLGHSEVILLMPPIFFFNFPVKNNICVMPLIYCVRYVWIELKNKMKIIVLVSVHCK